MSRYQSIKALSVQGNIVTIEVEEVHADMWTVHDMLQHAPLGQTVAVEGEDLEEGTFEVINGAAILMMSNSHVSEHFSEHELIPEAFVRAVTIRAATPIAESSSGLPMYRATLEIEMQRAEYAAAFQAWVGRSWDGYAYVMGDFDDMFF